MTRRIVAALLLAAGLSAVGGAQAAGGVVDTRLLIVEEASGALADDKLRVEADRAQALLDRILAFWSAGPGTDRFGKIRVVFEAPRDDTYSSVFFWDRRGGGWKRVVRVTGFAKTPQMMAHKLASALMPQKDKLIRNMMGIVTEVRLGNPLTFPDCGFANDDWVRAFLDMGSTIPLADLGADHQSWGMTQTEDGRTTVHDRAKQHRAYAESGSFGLFVADAYGIDGLKRLHGLAQNTERPMREALGAPLKELEARWLAGLKAKRPAGGGDVAVLTRLLAADPRTACAEAQAIKAAGRQAAGGRRPGRRRDGCLSRRPRS